MTDNNPRAGCYAPAGGRDPGDECDARVVETRTQTPAPAEPGWYYARPIGDTKVRSVEASRFGNLLVVRDEYGCIHWIAEFDWFGAVAEVVAA